MNQEPFDSLGLDWGRIKRNFEMIPVIIGEENRGKILLKSLISVFLYNREMHFTVLGGTLIGILARFKKIPLRLFSMEDTVSFIVDIADKLIEAVNDDLFQDIDIEVKILIMYSLRSWIREGEYNSELSKEKMHADFLIGKIDSLLDANSSFVLKLNNLKGETYQGKKYFEANAGSSLNILKIIDRLTTKMVDL